MEQRNQNRPFTVEFAVRHAMGVLGADRVAGVLGCSTSQLYKSTQAHPTRALPDLTWLQVCRLVEMLRGATGHDAHRAGQDQTEYFSDVLQAVGQTITVPSFDIHLCLTHATADVGAFARLLLETTHKPRQADLALTIDDLSRIAVAGRQAISSISMVVSVCGHHGKAVVAKKLEIGSP